MSHVVTLESRPALLFELTEIGGVENVLVMFCITLPVCCGVDVPEKYRLETCRSALLLLPDANRSAVYQLMTFLRHISQLSEQNQVS